MTTQKSRKLERKMLWLILTVGVVTAAYFYFSKKFSYFKNHGVPYEPGSFPLGSSNSWKVLSGQMSMLRSTDEIHVKYPNDKIVGYYAAMGEPVLLINDIDLGKRILVKDFDHFVDRRPIKADKEVNKYFVNMLTSLNGKSKTLFLQYRVFHIKLLITTIR